MNALLLCLTLAIGQTPSAPPPLPGTFWTTQFKDQEPGGWVFYFGPQGKLRVIRTEEILGGTWSQRGKAVRIRFGQSCWVGVLTGDEEIELDGVPAKLLRLPRSR